jgi:CBS domain-containing protein
MHARSRIAVRDTYWEAGSMEVAALLEGREPVTSWPEQRVAAAARLMSEHNIGAVPVMQDDRVAGMLSERDISRAVGVHEGTLGGLRVVDLMTAEVVCCRSGASLQEAMELMERHHIRHLPVLDPGRRLLGVISQRDVLASLLAAVKADTEAGRERVLLEKLRSMKGGGGPG